MRNKRGISEIVAYVLLVVFGLSLSILVYSWLKFYVSPSETKDCPESVSVVLENVIYNCTGVYDLNVTVRNRGLFSINGTIIRVNDREDAETGFYVLNDSGVMLIPGDKTNFRFESIDEGGRLIFKDYKGNDVSEYLTFIEVQSFIYEKGERVYCSKVSSQKLKCA